MTKVIAVTDLGPGNTGSIAATDLSPELRAEIIKAAANPEYHRPPTARFRCVDGRTPAARLDTHPDLADPQEAGGAAISEAAADMMNQPDALSTLIVKNVEQNITYGYEVVVHGDTTHGKSGCGANKNMRAVLRANAVHTTVVGEMAWILCQALGLDTWLSRSSVDQCIRIGGQAAKEDSLWDLTPEEVVDIAVKHGAEYEELIEDHLERIIVVDTSLQAFEETRFMRDYTHPDGRPIEAFVASLGAANAKLFDIGGQIGQSRHVTAQKMLGVVLFNLGVPKILTAESTRQNPHAALPVVVLGGS